MDEIAAHLLRSKFIQEAEHTIEEHAVWTVAKLLGHKDPGMDTARNCPLFVQRSEVANVESEDGTSLVGREVQLVFVRGGVTCRGFCGLTARSRSG
jgi:hypothetical protein